MRGLGEALRIAKLSGMRKLEVERETRKRRKNEGCRVRDMRRWSSLAQAALQSQGYA